MRIKTYNKTKLCLIIALAVILLNIGLSLILFPSLYAAASTATAYSNVFDDLSQAYNFDVGLYPSNSSDYSISVIQIAESSDNELFVYTYQPSQRSTALNATKVNMSLSDSVATTQLYNLKLLSQEGVFCKYLVEGVTVDTSKSTRYYNISSIYRKWLSTVDVDSAVDNNVVDAVAYAVAQCWSVWTTSDGSVRYDMHEQEVVNITSQFVGFRRLTDGFQWNGTYFWDSHYIAFNCDHLIDKLMSATIEFDSRVYTKVEGSDYKYEDPVHHVVNLYDYQVASNTGSGWFGKKEEWHRISSVSEFCDEVNMPEEDRKTISSYSWILNFYESEYKNQGGGKDILYAFLGPVGWGFVIKDALTTNGEFVSNVSLLRMEFEYDGQIYNLGVVSNSQTGSKSPTSTSGFDLLGWLEEKTGIPSWVWIVGAILIPIAILMPVLGTVFPVLGQILASIGRGVLTALKTFIKVLLWVIMLPFKIIASIIAKIKDRG